MGGAALQSRILTMQVEVEDLEFWMPSRIFRLEALSAAQSCGKLLQSLLPPSGLHFTPILNATRSCLDLYVGILQQVDYQSLAILSLEISCLHPASPPPPTFSPDKAIPRPPHTTLPDVDHNLKGQAYVQDLAPIEPATLSSLEINQPLRSRPHTLLRRRRSIHMEIQERVDRSPS